MDLRSLLLLLLAPCLRASYVSQSRAPTTKATRPSHLVRARVVSSTAGNAATVATTREALPNELSNVATLQLEIFAPPPEPPSLLPMLQAMFEASERNARNGMQTRLTQELELRVEQGSEIIVAVATDVEEAAVVDASGSYTEPGPQLLGSVDVSVQELQLPTHAIAGGMYLSHMAVAEVARRQGVGRSLLSAADECALRRGEDTIYLHVEKDNAAAIALYETSGYKRQPEVPPYVGFTQALNLQERAFLYAKELRVGDE